MDMQITLSLLGSGFLGWATRLEGQNAREENEKKNEEK